MFPHNARTARFGAIPPRFDLKPRTVGPPRLDKYHRLLSRLYEPLVLLRLLGQTQVDYKSKSRDLNKAQFAYRNFLRNLAYICDFDKGGDTCTAIGLEDLQTHYSFWVASNANRARITSFLRDALKLLRNVSGLPETEVPQKMADFVRFCVDFAKRRIAKEKNCLFKAVESCQQKLLHSTTLQGTYPPI